MDTKRIPLFVFFLVVIILVVVVMIRNGKTNQLQAPSTTAPVAKGPVLSPTPQKTMLGSFSLKLTSPQTMAKVGTNLSLDLVFDTGDVGIVGYDALVGFDTASFDLVSVSSEDTNFNIYKRVHSDYLTLTGAEKLSSKNSVKFRVVPVATIVVRPKKAGEFVFSTFSQKGKETSDFVDDRTKVYYPEVAEIKVIVE